LGGREQNEQGKRQINPKENLMGFANNVVKVIESIASPQKDCTGHRIVDFLG